MTRYLGGLITKDESKILPANGFEDTSAPGVWTLEEALTLSKQSRWPTAGVSNPAKFVENVFSTHLYTGTDANNNVQVNGIDLLNEGGLVWIKSRTNTGHHRLIDTARGDRKLLSTNNSDAELTDQGATYGLNFNNNGFTVRQEYNGDINGNQDYVSWSFRKAPKFFDVQIGTTDNSGHIDLTHSLEQEPGIVIVKRRESTSTGNWFVYHRSLGVTKYLNLDTTGAAANFTAWANVTSTTFRAQIGFGSAPADIVAYFFGHDTSSDGMIQCGNFTGTGSQITTTLGFEPQWLMFKRTDSSAGGGWGIVDNIRGWIEGGNSSNFQLLEANATDAEAESSGPGLISTGFTSNYSNGREYIYMAIRKGKMQTPTTSSTVFGMNSFTTTSSTSTIYDLGIKHDMVIGSGRAGGGVSTVGKRIQSRITGMGLVGKTAPQLETTHASTENNRNDFVQAASSNNAVQLDAIMFDNTFLTTAIFWAWSNAKGYFDSVAYTGNGSAGRQINHSLSVSPEMLWIKGRNVGQSWRVYHSALGEGKVVNLNSSDAVANNVSYLNNTAPSSTVITLGQDDSTNGNYNYVAYLFASATGVSKVGSFSHTNGSSTDVDCGFSSGSKFVLVKRTDDTGDWYVWDSTRGIVSGNDPYTLFNTGAAEVTNTDYIDTLSSGFQIASGFTTGDYIFYAIAA